MEVAVCEASGVGGNSKCLDSEMDAARQNGQPTVLKTPIAPDTSPPGLHMPVTALAFSCGRFAGNIAVPEVDCGVPYPIWRGVGLALQHS